jgi:hypothetical protein
VPGRGFCVVLGRLWFLMVQDNDVWMRRSQERWSFRSVPAKRGRCSIAMVRCSCTMRRAQLSVYYLRFRLRHPVGACVRGDVVGRPAAGSRRHDLQLSRWALDPRGGAARGAADPGACAAQGRARQERRERSRYVATTVPRPARASRASGCSSAARHRCCQARERSATLTVPRAGSKRLARNLASLHRIDRDVLARHARARGTSESAARAGNGSVPTCSRRCAARASPRARRVGRQGETSGRAA